MTSKTMTPGQALIETLKNEGVEYVFGIVGSAFLGLLDALYAREDIRFIGVRHEQGAAFMADGYARISGKPGVCVGTSGPGATNLVTGVAAAYLAYSPVVALAGSTGLGQQHRDVVQELDQVSIFRPITKLSMAINKAERVPELTRHAIRVAMSGRKGPVYIDMPRDAFEDRPISVDLLSPGAYRDAVGGQQADGRLIQQAGAMLLRAQRPVIITGGGVTASGATNEVVQLAELLGIPMVAGYGRQDSLPNTHPLYVGHIGRAAAPEAMETVRRADVILALGTRLSQFTTAYDTDLVTPEAKLIQVDIEPREIGRVFPVAAGIVADARAVTSQLVAFVRSSGGAKPLNPAWTERAKEASQARWRRLDAEGSLSGTPMKPQRVYHEMRKVLPKDTIALIDAGAAPSYAQDRLVFNQPRSVLCPMDLATLGFAFPEALGAKLAAPHRPVVALHGDGGFLFNAQELNTAVREHIPVVCVVMNNGEWGSEKAIMGAMYHDRFVGADITNPRFDKLAEVYGAKGFYAERPADVGEALAQALKLDVPSVIEVPVDPKELPVPARRPN